MAGKEGTWTEREQNQAAERGQGAEIGAAHGPEGGRERSGQGAGDKAAFAGNKPKKAPTEKK